MAIPNDDAVYGRFFVSWRTPTGVLRSDNRLIWPALGMRYQIRIWDYSGGSPGIYYVKFPALKLYTFAPWNAKLHTEILAADPYGSFSKIKAYDIILPDHPDGATEDYDYPHKVSVSRGLTWPFIDFVEVVRSIETNPELEWIKAEITFEPSLRETDPHYNTFIIYSDQSKQFVIDCEAGKEYVQSTVVYYVGGSSEISETTFTA